MTMYTFVVLPYDIIKYKKIDLLTIKARIYSRM